jgi:hypothetical protein
MFTKNNKNNFLGISINSHPRSGTNFLRINLAALLNIPVEGIMKNPNVDHLRANPAFFQIVVIRNPRDTIFSAYSHGEQWSLVADPSIESIKLQIEKYLFYLKHYNDFKDNIKFYDFNNLEYALKDIALNFITKIPEDFSPIAPIKNNKFTPTMKDSEFYKKLCRMTLDENIFKEANLEYEKILELCKKEL